MSRGAFTFTTEMFTKYFLFHEKEEGWGHWFSAEYYDFEKYLLFGDALVPWEDYEHPQLGPIQIGGFKKNYIRVNPGFMLEYELHRLMAFSLYHAWHTPKLEIVELTSNDLGGGLSEVIAVIANKRMIPTHAGIDLKFKIERPNYISLEGGNVLAGMIVKNRSLNVVEEQKHNPAVMKVDNISGMSTVTVKWIVEKGNKLSVKVDSSKGGVVTRSL
jgi:hypothetical protein